VWQLLGIETIQNGGRCHGNQGALFRRVTCYDLVCVFQFFRIFGRFHGNSSHFENNHPLKAQLHIAYDIPTMFYKV
jgi:hypothetical protein